MKIILLQDVYKKGVAGEVVDVAPGYARNFLIPQSMAVKATPGAMRSAEGLRKQAVVRRADRDQEFTRLAEQIREMAVYFGVRAGETGKLYGSITPGDIAEQVKAQYGIELDRRRIGDHPLRDLGEFMVPVRLEASLAPQIKVTIFREGQDPREAEGGQAPAEIPASDEGMQAEPAPAEMAASDEGMPVEPAADEMGLTEETPSA
jgi:large subunit ribosomal protein L9